MTQQQEFWYEYELENLFDEMLDEVHGVITICGMEYDASRVFKNSDPIAYRVYFLDWMNAQGYVENEEGKFILPND